MRGLKFKVNVPWDKVRIPLILALLVAFALFLRVYWAVEPSIEQGFAVSGGSDSYYHERIIQYILDSGHQLLQDPMLNYPIGMNNPRPPLFHWAIVMSSFIFYPFYSPYDSAILMLILFPAIWGSLLVIPTYLLGKEAFNKKVGLLAAFLIATMPAAMTRSVATQADWDAFNLFFIVLSFYFFLRALKTVKYKYWIRDWFNKEEVKNGLKTFFAENKMSVIYAALSGVSLGTVALAWKGYTYGLAILVIYLFFQVFINRFRNKSNLHMVVLIGVYMLFAFGLAFPWYFVTHRLGQWFEVPLILIGGVFLIGLILEITGKYPWPFVFGISALLIGVSLFILNIFFPDIWEMIISGQGYFVKSKLYSTIAEAQPASLGYLAMSFGVGVFILSFGGIAILLYMIKREREEYYLFFVFFSIVSIYMAISAARFIFNASPAFALTGAIAIVWFIEILRFKESFEEFRKYRGSFKKKLKMTVKVSQVVFALVLAFLIVTPTVWSAVDAGIPYEEKKKYDKQIYGALPSFMKPNETTYNKSSPWYLGAFGFSLPKETYPWPRAWKWLRAQDNQTIPSERPAFVSWWDYGFESIKEGEHPAVADNFQNGYQMAAQIITAQNESEVIALFTIRLIEGDYEKEKHFSPGMLDILNKYFTPEDVEKIKEVMRNPGKFRETVLSNPDYYGLYESDISDKNTKYAYLKGMFAHHSEGFLIKLYDDVRNYTGKDIRYFAVDYRLFPFSGTNTGIFYAPAKLGDRRVKEFGGTVVPYDFYDLKVVDEYGNEYDLDKVPSNVRIVNYRIYYKQMFYNSMLYRTFIGYSGQDVGAGEGIPGISPGLYYYYPMQAWNLTHFKLVYRTAYWNPYEDYQNHTKDWKPIPIDLALKYQKEKKGVVELNPPAYQVLPNDVVMVKFYEGAVIEGNVKLTTGEPAKHIRITIQDEYGIPHASVFTDDKGRYRIEAVAGNLTLILSTNGKLNKLKMTEQTILYKTTINVSEEQAIRLKPNFVIHKDITINPANLDGIIYFDVNGNNKYDQGEDVKVESGTFILRNDTYGYNETSPITNGLYSIKDIPPHAYTSSIVLNGRRFDNVANITLGTGENLTKDIPITPSYLTGNVTYDTGEPAKNVTVDLIGIYARYSVRTDVNGSFKVMVVPDNYTVVAHAGNYLSDKEVVIVNLWNYTTTLNLIMHYAFDVKGIVEYNGERLGKTLIKITSELMPHTVYLVNSNERGEFDVKLPGGIYSLYSITFVGNTRVCYLGLINVNSNMSLTLRYGKAYKIYGYINASKDVKNAEIGIYGNDVFYRAFANNTNYFEAYLPAGKYVIGAIGFGEHRHPYFGRTIVHISSGSRYVEIALHHAYNVSGFVYYDRNGNGMPDEGETITNGLVMLYDDNGVYEIRNIPPNGKFSLPTTVDYKVKVLIWGYKEISAEKKNGEIRVKVEPEEVLLTGNLIRGSEINDIPVNIRFVPTEENSTTSYTVTGVVTNYSIYLPPGNYTVEIYGYNRSYTVETPMVKIQRGFEKASLDIKFRAFAHVTVISQAEYVGWFRDGINYTKGKEVTLPVGEYSMYAKNLSYASIMKVSIYENTTLMVPIYPSHIVTFDIQNYSTYTKVHIFHDGAHITAQGVIALPSETYTFEINETKEMGGGFYRFHASNTIQINGDTVVELRVVKEKMLTHLYGKLTYEGGVVGNTLIHFIPVGGSSNSNTTVVSDSSGSYEVYLTPGKYLVYSYFIYGAKYYANLSVMTVRGKDVAKDIVMENAYLVRGGTYIGDEEVNVNVYFRTQDSVISVQSVGFYWVILPEGNYTVHAQTTRQEYGLNVKYTFDSNVYITENTNYDVKLKRNTVHDVSGKILYSDIVAAPNSTMGVSLLIENNGNTVEKIKIEGTNGWNVDDSQKIELYPKEKRIVNLRLNVPLSAKYGENTFTIRIIYSDYSTQVSGTVNVTERYETELSEKLIGWSNSSLIYEVTISNKGNVEVNYTLSLLNGKELIAKGWKVEIRINDKTTNWIKVEPMGSKKVKVIATALRNNPSTVAPVLFSAFGDKSYVIKLQLQYPKISQEILYIKGKNVHNYSGITLPDYFYWVWGAAIALAVAIAIVGRYRK